MGDLCCHIAGDDGPVLGDGRERELPGGGDRMISAGGVES